MIVRTTPVKATRLTEEEEELARLALEEACERRLTVPVTMKKLLVGSAVLDRDGSMTIEIEQNPAGEELMSLLLRGTTNCISVGPNPDSPIAVI